MAEQMIRADEDLSEVDRELILAIRKTLWDYEPLRATKPVLDVQVDDGRVTLSGRVRTLAMKEIAEYLVRRLEGVRAIRNEVVADPEVVRAVADALAAEDDLAPLCVRIDARNGMAVLMGSAPGDEIIQRALDVASSVPVVAGVESRLVVQPESADGAVSTAARATNGLTSRAGQGAATPEGQESGSE